MSFCIRFRPHHFLCTVSFQGEGYSPEFIENYQNICEVLKGENGDLVEIEVINQIDSICQFCPNKRRNLCLTQEKVTSLDQRHSKVLNLKVGQKITWGEAKKRIANQVSETRFHEMCLGCSWKESGICLEALKKLKGSF